MAAPFILRQAQDEGSLRSSNPIVLSLILTLTVNLSKGGG
jgi:hypothetical protein